MKLLNSQMAVNLFPLNMRVALKLTWQNMENINVMVVFYNKDLD